MAGKLALSEAWISDVLFIKPHSLCIRSRNDFVCIEGNVSGMASRPQMLTILSNFKMVDLEDLISIFFSLP
jgi:hypothetical protein